MRSAFPIESMWFIPFYASNISCPRVFSFTKASSIAVLLYTSGDNKLELKIILGVILVKHLPIFSSPCDNCHKKSFAITVSFSLLFVTFEHNVNRLEQNMSPNMSYFKLKLSNLELHEFLFQNCQLYFTSCQLRLQKLLPPYNTYSA